MKRSRNHRAGPSRTQRGVATLIVVMVLFFVVAMVAAYTSRNLIFEQKTSANQYRSTMAFEAADAGIEWALAMLNGGTIDDTCDAAAAPALSFQQRYLAIASDPSSATNGHVTNPAGRTMTANFWPTCAFDGTRWGNPAHCTCPNNTGAAPAAPAGVDPAPAYRVWMADPILVPSQLIARPGVFTLLSNGCTRMPAAGEHCLDAEPEGVSGDGMASLQLIVALRSGLDVPPAAAVTARQGVTPDAVAIASLRVINTNAATNGITVNAGGAVATSRIAAESLPGTPAALTVLANDSRLMSLDTVAGAASAPALAPLSAAERMFVSQFGMTRKTYLEQPGLRRCAAPCTAAAINALLARNPNRIIWVEGDLSLDADVGLAAAPVLLIVNGDTLTLAAGVDVTGFVYLTGGAAADPVTIELPDGVTSITGALVSETSLATHYASGPSTAANELRVTYDPVVLNLLRTTYGSWVRVPGSWKDFN